MHDSHRRPAIVNGPLQARDPVLAHDPVNPYGRGRGCVHQNLARARASTCTYRLPKWTPLGEEHQRTVGACCAIIRTTLAPPYLGPAHPQSRCLRPNASAKIEVWRKPNHSLALTFPLPWFGEHRNHHRCRFDGSIVAISQFESCSGITATHTEIVSPRSSAQPILVLRSLRIAMAAGLYLRGELTLSANGECEAIWAS